jgi:hypothetical protein
MRSEYALDVRAKLGISRGGYRVRQLNYLD